MNNWKVICEKGWLPSIANCYSSAFPIEMRSLLASWLDRNPSYIDFDAKTPSHHEAIDGFLKTMILYLGPTVEAMPQNDGASFFYKTRLKEIAFQIQDAFVNDYLSLFNHVQESLRNENLEFQRLQNSSAPTHSPNPTNNIHNARSPFDLLDDALTYNLEEAKLHCKYIERNVWDIYSKTIDLQNLQHQLQQQGSNHFCGPLEEPELRAQFDKLQTEIPKLKGITRQLFANVWNTIVDSHPKVMAELGNFKNEQRFEVLGKEPERKLSTIEKWFGSVYNCISSFQQSLKNFQGLQSQLSQEEAAWMQVAAEKFSEATNLRNSLVFNSLVFETQPKPVIHSKTKAGVVKLRVLIPNSHIDKKGVLKAMFIEEEQVTSLFNKPNHEPTESLLVKLTKCGPKIEQNRVEFRDFRAEKVSRAKGTEKLQAGEEKFSIYFRICVALPDHGDKHVLWITSLPVAVTIHPNQDCVAWASIFWDYAFSARDRRSFQVPDEVPWTQLIEAINWRFLSLATDKRRGLTEENKNYLKQTLFRSVNPVGEMITWNQFCKEEFLKIKPQSRPKAKVAEGENEESISFWGWIFSCLKLLLSSPDNINPADRGLRKMWGNGHILGFMSEESMKTVLKTANQYQAGTFILRFSESRPGAIGICYYNCSAEDPNTALVKLEPYTSTDLKKKELPDRILDNPLIHYLYLGIGKEEAFVKTSELYIKTVGGYVQLNMKEEFPRDMLRQLKQGYVDPEETTEAASPLSSTPWTPSSSCQSFSPAATEHRSGNSSSGEDNLSEMYLGYGDFSL